MAGSDVRIQGAEQLRALGAAIRALGDDRTIFKTLGSRIRRMLPGIKKELKASAVETLPETYGFGKRVAESSFRLSLRRGADTAGASVVISGRSAKGKTDLFDLDDSGTFRAPLFGNRQHWYPHVTEAGWASTPWQGPVADEFRDQVLGAIDDAFREVFG